ncbi:hypothetical protein SEA_ATUIN_134 [Arthrobacter phage Atuin]|nr:hypothetical protein SEA_ATUIN_233 [Arthrobacter phage Atuin]
MKKYFSQLRNLLEDPKFTTEFHKWATIVWIGLLIPSILFWSELLLWVVLMSVWANIAGHWSAYQASRAELKQDQEAYHSCCKHGDGCGKIES